VHEVSKCLRKYTRITLQLKLFTLYEPQKISVTDQSSLKSIAVKKRNQTGDMMKLSVLKEVKSWSETGHLQI
jgi:hypothetical protein